MGRISEILGGCHSPTSPPPCPQVEDSLLKKANTYVHPEVPTGTLFPPSWHTPPLRVFPPGRKGSKGRAVSGDQPVGAASCSPNHTKVSYQAPPPPGWLKQKAGLNP